jgi:hypothetical protein
MECVMRRLTARLTLAILALLTLAGILLAGSWMAAPAVFFSILAAAPPVRARDGWWGLVGAATGLLGGGLGIATALLAITERSTEHPYDARVGFALAALALASLAFAGGALLPSRPRPAIGMLLVGSAAGCVAMAFFTIATWYFVALPLCWFAAAIAVARAAAPVGASRGAA